MIPIIDRTAIIGENVKIGNYVVIGKNVIIGNNVQIGSHTVIHDDTIIGDNVIVQSFTSLGQSPLANKKMAQKPDQNLMPLVIDEHVKIGSHCVIYRGTALFRDVLVGDFASIREKVKIGSNSIIGRDVMVENNTQIGERVTVQTSSYVTAFMIIEDDVFIGPRFSSSNDKYMGQRNAKLIGPVLKRNSKIGNNASLLPGVIIGEGAIVGAGAVVTKDVKPKKTVVGNPAKTMEK